MNKNKIAVLGAGTMGPGIALTYALQGFETTLYSRSQKTLDRAASIIRTNLALFVRENILTQEEADAAGVRMRYTDSVADAVAGAWYVAETIVEQADAKTQLYRQLDDLLPPEVIIASNTSYMNIFELMPQRRRPYTVIAHFYAPAHILPLVEVVRGPETSDAVMDSVMELHRQCGKTPVRMEKYIPGFIVNRLQSAMTREVLYLIENGYCTAEDLDLAVKTSLMPRGLILGLVQRMDFTGLDMMANSLNNNKYTPAPAPEHPELIFGPVERGEYGVKSGKGLYDYAGQTYEQVLDRRDTMLLRAVAMANKSIGKPLHKKEK